jgi:hypothetical protein
MKRLILLLPLLGAGCVSKHTLPTNAFMQDVESKITTPWGSHTLVIGMAATGEAAKNVSLPEPVPKKK